MKKINLGVLLLCCTGSLVSSSSVFAAGIEKLYVGASVGSSNFYGDAPAVGQFEKGQHFDAGDDTYEIHLGYQVNNWFSAEVGYSDFGRARDTFQIKKGVFFIVAPNNTQDLSAKSESVSAIFSYNVLPEFSVSGLLGVANVQYKTVLSGGFIKQKDSVTEQGLVYGVRAAYKISEKIALCADLHRTDAGDYKIDTASVGLNYNF